MAMNPTGSQEVFYNKVLEDAVRVGDVKGAQQAIQELSRIRGNGLGSQASLNSNAVTYQTPWAYASTGTSSIVGSTFTTAGWQVTTATNGIQRYEEEIKATVKEAPRMSKSEMANRIYSLLEVIQSAHG